MRRVTLTLAGVVVAALLLACGAFVQAQSYQVSLPARSPFLASYAFAASGALSLLPTGGQTQYDAPTGTAQINSGNLTGAQSFTVINSTYAVVKWLGVSGLDTNQYANNCYLTPVRTDAFTLTVTCNRTTIGNSDGPANPSYGVVDVSSTLIDNVQWGQPTTAAPWTYSACPGGVSHTELSYLGAGPVNAGGSDFKAYLTLASSTSVTLTSTVAGTKAGAQVVCLK